MSLPDLDPRFDDLVRDLRAARPQPSPALATRIASIAEAPAAPTRARRSWRRPAFVLVPLAAVVVAALGAGLLFGGGSSKPNVVAGKSLAAQRAHAAAQRSAAEKRPAHGAATKRTGQLHTFGAATATTPSATAPTSDAAPAAADSLAPAPFRATEEHASFTLQLANRDALAHATQQAMRIARSLGGYVVSAQTSQPGDGQGDATLLLKVPIGHAQQAVTRLTALGHVLSQQIDLQDLQAPLNAQHDRATALRASIAKLQDALARGGLTFEARSQLHVRIAQDRAQLAAVLTTTAALARRGRLATFALDLTTRHSSEPVLPSHPGKAHRTLTHAWHLLGRELAFVAAALLLVAPLALLGAIAVGARRVMRRREEARHLATTR
jgi:hypothetical protein